MKAVLNKFIIFFVLCVLVVLYFQFIAVDDFKLEETTFLDSEYQAGLPVLLDSGSVTHGKPVILSDQNETIISWINKKDTKLAMSTDGEGWIEQTVPVGVQTATSPADFDLSSGAEGRLHLAQTSADGVYVSYRENKNSDWSEPYNIAASVCEYYGCRNPRLVYAESTNILYGIFVQAHHKNPRGVYVLSSANNGESWSAPILVREIPYANPTVRPTVSTNDGALFISYDGELYRSADEAYTWDRVGHNMSKYEISNIKNIGSSSDLYAVWPAQEIKNDDLNPFDGGSRSGNELVLFSRQVHGKWIRPVVLNDAPLTFIEEIIRPNESFTEYLIERSGILSRLDFMDYTVSEDGRVIGVLWEDGRNDISNLFFTHSSDGGNTWHENQLINTRGQNVLRGSIQVLDDQSFQVAFVSFVPNYENQIEITSPTSLYVVKINK